MPFLFYSTGDQYPRPSARPPKPASRRDATKAAQDEVRCAISGLESWEANATRNPRSIGPRRTEPLPHAQATQPRRTRLPHRGRFPERRREYIAKMTQGVAVTKMLLPAYRQLWSWSGLPILPAGFPRH